MMHWPPEDAVLVAEFSVVGHPQTAGSKVAHIPRRKDGSMVTRGDGSPMVVSRDSSGAKGQAWRSDVAAAAMALGLAEEEGPLAVEMVFYRQRPRGHYGTGRNAGVLKPSAPRYPTMRPDALKLGRSVEDSLASILYRDDAQIVRGRYDKDFGSPERVEVKVWRLPELMGEDARPEQPTLAAAG